MPEDADAAKGLISTTSPIGRAFLNKEPGDTVKVDDAGRHARVRDRQAVHHPRRSGGMTDAADARRRRRRRTLLTATPHRARADRHRHGRRLSRRRAARAARSRRQDRHRRRPRHRRCRRCSPPSTARSGCGTRRASGIARRGRQLYPWHRLPRLHRRGRWRCRWRSSRCRCAAMALGLVVFPIDFVLEDGRAAGGGGLVGCVPAASPRRRSRRRRCRRGCRGWCCWCSGAPRRGGLVGPCDAGRPTPPRRAVLVASGAGAAVAAEAGVSTAGACLWDLLRGAAQLKQPTPRSWRAATPRCLPRTSASPGFASW